MNKILFGFLTFGFLGFVNVQASSYCSSQLEMVDEYISGKGFFFPGVSDECLQDRKYFIGAVKSFNKNLLVTYDMISNMELEANKIAKDVDKEISSLKLAISEKIANGQLTNNAKDEFRMRVASVGVMIAMSERNFGNTLTNYVGVGFLLGHIIPYITETNIDIIQVELDYNSAAEVEELVLFMTTIGRSSLNRAHEFERSVKIIQSKGQELGSIMELLK